MTHTPGPTPYEPIGCPTPGACSCLEVAALLSMLKRIVNTAGIANHFNLDEVRALLARVEGEKNG